MSRHTETTGRVSALVRAGQSHNGNPTWRVTIRLSSGPELTLLTRVDGQVGYYIENPEFRTADTTFTVNGDNRIIGAELAK